MSANQGGSFATFLLTILLAAIPLMAIFGIPEFAHVTASEDAASAAIRRRPSRQQPDDQSTPSQAQSDFRDRATDLFAPRQEPVSDDSLTDRGGLEPINASDEGSARDPDTVSAARSTLAPKHGDRLSASSSERLSVDSHPSPRPMPTAAVAPRDEQHVAGDSTREASSGLTWREAARRLEDVGITNYRLERGHRTDRFLFVCLFSPGSDLRITQRFEAESREPLSAVEDVLAQVDNWLQHRHAESRRWVR